MAKIKALENVGAHGAFRLLRTNREVELPDEKVNAGVIRLWKKGSILIDGETYTPSSKYVPKEEKSAPKQEAKKDVDDKVEKEPVAEKNESRELKMEDTLPPVPPTEKNTDIDPQQEEQSDEDKDEQEATPEPDPGVDGVEKTEEEKVDSIVEYVLSKDPGFFNPENLKKKNLDTIREIGSNVGVEVKTKKKGAKDIAEKVTDILDQ